MGTYPEFSKLNGDACHIHNATASLIKARGGDFDFDYLVGPASALLKRAKELLPDDPMIKSLVEIGGGAGKGTATEICALTALIREAAYRAADDARPPEPQRRPGTVV